MGGRANWRRRGGGWRSRRRRGDSLCDQNPAAIELHAARQAEAAGVRYIFRAGSAGQEDSVGLVLVVVMVNRFLIGDGFVACNLNVRAPR
jgi:hypothetical protein